MRELRSIEFDVGYFLLGSLFFFVLGFTLVSLGYGTVYPT
jgi:hypothetical protein